MDGRIVDRWLAYHEDIDARNLQEGEQVVVRRAMTAVDSNLESKDVRPRPRLRIVKTEGDGS
jgi:hypothetical protein